MALENTVAKPEGEPQTAENTRSGRLYRPLVDIIELTDELLVLADLPGATADNTDIRFEDGMLTLHARVEPRRGADLNYALCEYGVGDYFRTFRISEAIDASKIAAEYRDGVLTLHLPKTEAVKPRKISVAAR